jgi:4-hydroxy-3-methylbut-2-enyl diphosphate reductase
MKKFNVPPTYRSPLITAIKMRRKEADKLKKDFSPTLLDMGRLKVWLARHFGFCYGVENAIEIAFETITKNPGKRIFLLSEMIHNPQVNEDLIALGVRFLQDTKGNQLIPFDELTSEDIVIIPAFGTTLAIESQLKEKGIETAAYNTTCPFVEKVWNRGEQIAAKGYTIVVHGKPKHEETRATFSRAAAHAPTIIVNDLDEAKILGEFITGERAADSFQSVFASQFSAGFDPTKHLQKIGVINQTTQLSSDTQAIAEYLKQVMIRHHQLTPEKTSLHFADTRDTLCYATNDNQTAVREMLSTPADLAIVIGGYNSSNTSHLVELCEQHLPTWFIDSPNRLLSDQQIEHRRWDTKELQLHHHYLPTHQPINLLITSGASCPDAVVDQVIKRLAGFYGAEGKLNSLTEEWCNA